MDEYEADIGSPSPPFEGVIKEEAEKQLESNGSEFEEIKHDSVEKEPQVNIFMLFLHESESFL